MLHSLVLDLSCTIKVLGELQVNDGDGVYIGKWQTIKSSWKS